MQNPEPPDTEHWAPRESKVISDELVRVTLGGKPERPELLHLGVYFQSFADSLREGLNTIAKALEGFGRRIEEARKEHEDGPRG